jgi:hypothetical protein
MMSSWWKGYEAGMSGEGSNPYMAFSYDWFVYEAGLTAGCHVLADILTGIMKHDRAAEKSF